MKPIVAITIRLKRKECNINLIKLNILLKCFKDYNNHSN